LKVVLILPPEHPDDRYPIALVLKYDILSSNVPLVTSNLAPILPDPSLTNEKASTACIVKAVVVVVVVGGAQGGT
jgi:hypothetical protein